MKNDRCILKTSTILNCETVGEGSGACEGCKAGFILIKDDVASNINALVSSFSRSSILSYRCVPIVTNCISYNNMGQCLSCDNDPTTGNRLYPD